MPKTDYSLDHQLPVEQLALLHKQSIISIFATLAVLFYIFIWIQELVPATTLSLWISSIIACNAYLAILLYLVHRAKIAATINRHSANRFIFMYQIQAVLHGSAWSILPFLLIGQQSAEINFFSYLILGGMAAGAIVTTAIVFRIYLSFILPMLAPIIAAQLFFTDQYLLFTANTIEIFIIFVVSLIFLAHAYYKNNCRSIALLLKNKNLLQDVTNALKKTEAASKAKSEFLANISHELRTPLNAIIGYSEIIEEDSGNREYNSVSDDVKKINKAGKHLLSLINDLLDLSKIEAGKMNVYIEDIDADKFLHEIKASTENLIHKNNNTLTLTIEQNIDTIKSDQTKLRQILLNILSNSAKFTQDGEIKINVASDANNLNIVISDTGIGMTKKQLSELTIPFMQGDISTTRKYGGTGLGMSLTKRLTDLLNIDLIINSQLKQGTSVELVIPRHYSAA